jgi:hypothetical protein
MKAPRGLFVLQLGSALLMLVAATLYQSRSALAPEPTALAPEPTALRQQRALYERYESALALLEENRPLLAAELLSSFPDTELKITNALLIESGMSHCPAGLFLRMGVLLAHHATRAAQSGAWHQAKVLRDSCAVLQWRMARGGHVGESAVERTQRLQVSEQLLRCTARAEAAISLYQIS